MQERELHGDGEVKWINRYKVCHVLQKVGDVYKSTMVVAKSDLRMLDFTFKMT